MQEHDPAGLSVARQQVCDMAARYRIGVILPMEWGCPHGILNVAFVISGEGRVLGCQPRNQLAPEEDWHYVPGYGRQMFRLGALSFGISICHEGWRYPETVRWPAVRGAAVVFHPHHAGNDSEDMLPDTFAAADSAYYELCLLRTCDDVSGTRERSFLRECRLCASLPGGSDSADIS